MLTNYSQWTGQCEPSEENTNSSGRHGEHFPHHFYLCSFDLVCSELMQLQPAAASQVVAEAQVYIRLFPSEHKKLFFSIIIQGSLFINIFYKTNINFTSPGGSVALRLKMFNAKLLTHSKEKRELDILCNINT